MSEFIDNLLERPLSHRIGIWLGTLFVIAMLFWQFSLSKLITQTSDLEEKIDNLKSEIQTETRLIRDISKVKEAVKDLDAKLKEAVSELPKKDEIPGLLSSISDLAKDAGLEVTLFKPKGENRKEFYAEVPVSISVEGTYHQVASFFDEVGRLPRIVNISDISFRTPLLKEDKSAMMTKVNCNATTFRYLDESERHVAEEESSGNSKRKRGKK